MSDVIILYLPTFWSVDDYFVGKFVFLEQKNGNHVPLD